MLIILSRKCFSDGPPALGDNNARVVTRDLRQVIANCLN